MNARHPRPGDLFGRLTVVRDAAPPPGVHANSHRYLLCRCRCGNHTTTTSAALRAGRTRSCGCLMRDLRRLRRADRLRADLKETVSRLPEDIVRSTILVYLEKAEVELHALTRAVDRDRHQEAA